MRNTVSNLILPLSIALAACGTHIDDHDADQADDGDGANQLELHITGAYVATLTSDQVTCVRRVDGQVVDLRFHQTGGPQDGLDVALSVSGDFHTGSDDDDSDDDDSVATPQAHSYSAALTTPDQTLYAFTSAGAPAGASGALALTKATTFTVSGNLQLTDLPATPGAGKATVPLSAQGSFSCQHWSSP